MLLRQRAQVILDGRSIRDLYRVPSMTFSRGLAETELMVDWLEASNPEDRVLICSHDR